MNEPPLQTALFKAANLLSSGGIIFTSASSVRAFFEIMEKDHDRTELIDMLQKIAIISIGPFTSDELKKFNVENVIADVQTVSGAFDAVRNIFIS